MSGLEFSLKYDSLPLSKRFETENTVKTKLSMKSINQYVIDGNQNVNIDFIDPETGYTPLIVAVIQGKLPVVRVLIERGANLEYEEPNRKRTVLILAAKHGQLECVDELLKRGVLVNKADKFNMTALMYASKEGHTDCVKILLNRMAGPNCTDENGYTAMHYACKFGHLNIVSLLYERGGSLEIRDLVEGKTPLHIASQYGKKDVVARLLDFEAKVNRRTTFDKFTAVMLASKEGYKSIVSLLIARGADVNLVDAYGWSPLHFASSWGRKDTTLILIVEGNADTNSCESDSKGNGKYISYQCVVVYCYLMI